MTTPPINPSPAAPTADEALQDQSGAPLVALRETNAWARLQAWAPDPDAGQKYQLGIEDLLTHVFVFSPCTAATLPRRRM